MHLTEVKLSNPMFQSTFWRRCNPLFFCGRRTLCRGIAWSDGM